MYQHFQKVGENNYYNINRLFMITITKKEEVVLNQVEIFNPEYPDGVPIKFLKDELGFHEYDLIRKEPD